MLSFTHISHTEKRPPVSERLTLFLMMPMDPYLLCLVRALRAAPITSQFKVIPHDLPGRQTRRQLGAGHSPWRAPQWWSCRGGTPCSSLDLGTLLRYALLLLGQPAVQGGLKRGGRGGGEGGFCQDDDTDAKPRVCWASLRDKGD